MNILKDFDLLEQAFNDFNIEYDDQVLGKFECYMNLVLEWNNKVNLTSIIDPENFIIKHFIDSISCAADDYFNEATKVIDIGTGAGFPGMPLAIISPKRNFTLVDSLNKRVKVLKDVINNLGLGNVEVIHGRAEELARESKHREAYDLCTSRAVSRLSVLSEYCLPFVKKNGYFASYKTMESDKEIFDAGHAIDILGGKLEKISGENMLKYGLSHRILYIKKVKNTPDKYPRKAGIPEKMPL